MPIRWISVSPRPIAIGANPWGCALVGRTQNDHQEHKGQHDFSQEAGADGIQPGRVRGVSIQRSPRSCRARLAARNLVKHAVFLAIAPATCATI